MTVMYPQTQVWQITFKKEREMGRGGWKGGKKQGKKSRDQSQKFRGTAPNTVLDNCMQYYIKRLYKQHINVT